MKELYFIKVFKNSEEFKQIVVSGDGFQLDDIINIIQSMYNCKVIDAVYYGFCRNYCDIKCHKYYLEV